MASTLVQEASEDRESRVVRSRMEELVARVQPDALKKPGFAIIQDVPCRITEINHKPKATANGNKRLHLVGLHGACGCASIARAVRGDAVSR